MTMHAPPGGRGAARATYLIARRELVTRLRGKVFVVGTLVSVALLAVFAILEITVFSTIKTTTTYAVAFTAEAAPIAPAVASVAAPLGFDLHGTYAADPAAAQTKVSDGTLLALVSGAPTAPRVVVKSQLPTDLSAALNYGVQQAALSAELRSAGLNAAEVEARANKATFHLDVLQPLKPHALEQPILGAVLGLALYIFLGIYAGVIAQGVVAEKASRVIEVLLSTVRSGELLLGKILGIAGAGLIQFLLIAGCGLALTVPTGVLSVPGAAVGSMLGGVLWFVLGLILYALMIGALASRVSRVEESTAATLPVTLLLVMGWLLAYVIFIPQFTTATTGAAAPAGVTDIGTVASLIPFFTPILMPIRIAAGDVPVWQLLLAVALTLATIAAVAWVGARVYANSVLRFGARIRLVDALRRAP